MIDYPADIEWPQRGRGGFWRNYRDQAVVGHPDGGKRKLAYPGASAWWPFSEPYEGDPIHGERGSHVHALCDLADRGEPLDDDFIAAGEALGISGELQAYIYARWVVFLKAHGIEVVAAEQPFVNDVLRVASNADRIIRRTT